jgi:Icc-related predicted phosphoesterase
MKIIVVSDTHGKHKNLDSSKLECDTFIHAGDITTQGELSTLLDFSFWLKDIPANNKIVIFGNHEIGFQNGPKRQKAIEMIKETGAYYLENNSIIIDGIKFYGSPATPYFFGWEWNYQRGEEIGKQWSQIPDDVNVLITHGPPYGILDLVEDTASNAGRDLHQGCADLRKRISSLTQLKAHVFGHLHLNGGQMVKIADTVFANGAICTERYAPTNLSVVFEI